jgi:transposase
MEVTMEVLLERCCGLDVHQMTVVACALITTGSSKLQVERREFSAMTDGLRELCAWLAEHQITHVAMEGTGSYWVPIYAALEEDAKLDVTVANAQHIQKVPGRKTDWSDARWIAQLLRVGMLRKSFVPDAAFRALRDLTRARRSLVQDRTRQVNRLQKVLVTANVKLGAVISDIFGVSGVEMVRALLAGKQTAREIAALARGAMRRKIPLITRALEGQLLAHHKCLLQIELDMVDAINGYITKLDAEISTRFEPYRAEIELLDTIPGVDAHGAEYILSEIGVDMSRFATPGNLASWAGVLPANNLSAGKPLGGRRRNGNIHLTTILVELALGAARTKGTYLRDKYYRLKAARGAKRAAVAIANKIICAVHRMLSQRVGYRELGESFLDGRDHARTVNRLMQRLARMGVNVTVVPEQKPSEAP